MADEQVKFVLRLPASLHRKLRRRAQRNSSSMNREITTILEAELGKGSADTLLRDLIARLEAKKII